MASKSKNVGTSVVTTEAQSDADLIAQMRAELERVNQELTQAKAKATRTPRTPKEPKAPAAPKKTLEEVRAAQAETPKWNALKRFVVAVREQQAVGASLSDAMANVMELYSSVTLGIIDSMEGRKVTADDAIVEYIRANFPKASGYPGAKADREARNGTSGSADDSEVQVAFDELAWPDGEDDSEDGEDNGEDEQ